MQNHIKHHLTTSLPLEITPSIAQQLVRMVIVYELRDEHPLTLNSQMFGVNKFVFTTSDRQLFFDIVGYTEDEVTAVIKKIPSINKEFKVISDAFNIMCVYVVHLILNAKINANLKHDSAIAVLNYMQYRFMGSAINHYFPHKANYEIMQTVVESLNMKFSVRQLESWRAVVVERSEALTFNTKIHSDTLLKLDNDKNILYLITDTSTRIRSQLKIITSAYYETREANAYITSHSSTASLDGEKVLREKGSSFETISNAVFNKILIKPSFIDEHMIKMIQHTVPRLNVGLIRRMLSVISDEARYQMDNGKSREVIKQKDGSDLYVGIEVLVDTIIYIIYTSAIHNKSVNINSKIAIYTNTKNVFTAARTSNQELINVRASLDHLMKRTKISSRDATISGLNIGFVLYMTLMSFKVI